jgi:putative phosphoesterase
VVEAAVDAFADATVDAVVHCGDFVAPFSATPFDADFDFYAVRGNNDGEWALADAVESFGTYLGEMGELTLGGREFAVYHGTSEPIVGALLTCGSYDYVLRGHTHQRVHEAREYGPDGGDGSGPDGAGEDDRDPGGGRVDVTAHPTEGESVSGTPGPDFGADDTPAGSGDRSAERRVATVHVNPGGVPIPGQEAPPAGVLIDTDTGQVRFEVL